MSTISVSLKKYSFSHESLKFIFLKDELDFCIHLTDKTESIIPDGNSIAISYTLKKRPITNDVTADRGYWWEPGHQLPRFL